jgi:uncharacterized protein YndB with AHSA1/START domain
MNSWNVEDRMTEDRARAQPDLSAMVEETEQAMSEFGVVTAPRTLCIRRVLPGPVERVWAYLTESEKRGRWLATGPMELRVGGRVELNFRHADLSPEVEPTPDKYRQFVEGGATIHGRITRCEPPGRLSYTFDEDGGEPSEVTFELTPQGEDVLLVLTHRRLRDRGQMLSVSGGWHTHLGILLDHLAGRQPRPFWSTHARLEAEYDRRLPAD